MLRSFLLVGVGGAFGSMARYGVNLLVGKLTTAAFPLATFLINITGCLIIGVLFGFGQRNLWLQSVGLLILATGFCGGFTTFSTFALENINLLQKQQLMIALIYTALSLVIGLLFCRFGLWLAAQL